MLDKFNIIDQGIGHINAIIAFEDRTSTLSQVIIKDFTVRNSSFRQVGGSLATLSTLIFSMNK